MTLEIAVLLVVLGAMVTAFLTEVLPVDVTAVTGLLVLVLLGYVGPDEAFTGFSSPAVVTILAVFILGGALLETGVADRTGALVHRLVGSREAALVVTVMLTTAALSAFMSNVAAVAVMMPAVAGISRRARLAPSRLFMPLSFGAVLGGMTTAVGTPPNILATEILRDRGLEPFQLFDFAPVGLALLAAGTVYMATVGRRLLPERGLEPAGDERDLEEIYALDQRTFALRIPAGSPLDGRTLEESELGSALGVQVIALRRRSRLGRLRRLEPAPETELRSGDDLVVLGPRDEVEERLRVQGLGVDTIAGDELPDPASGEVTAARLRLKPASRLRGHTLRELGFRERYGAVVVAVGRGEVILRDRLGERPLEDEDRLFVVGQRERVAAFGHWRDLEVRATGSRSMAPLGERLFVLSVDESSPLVGRTLGRSRIAELSGLTVGAVLREGMTLLAVGPDETIRAGDRLVVAGEPARLVGLARLGSLEVDDEVHGPPVADRSQRVEAAVAPRSQAAGKTLRALDFRDRYGLQVLALWRGGERRSGDLADVELQFGDALLLQGPPEKALRFGSDADFVVLTRQGDGPRRPRKAPFALGALALLVVLVATGWQPIHVASFVAAMAVVLSGALRMDEAYRAVDWRAVFLIAALLPLGGAMERSGLAALLGGGLTDLAAPFGPYGILVAMALLAALLSQALDGAPAVVLVAPIALEAAARLGISPHAMIMVVGLAPSTPFLTPFSQKTNLLVMGAGCYRARDYLRVGTPLTVAVITLLVVLVPLVFPL